MMGVRGKFLNQEMFNSQHRRGNAVLVSWMYNSDNTSPDLTRQIRIHFIMQWVVTMINAHEDLREKISISSTKLFVKGVQSKI